MIEENIQQFFNLSGVLGLGIVLLDKELQPYFYFKERLPGEEKQSLIQSIIRLIDAAVKSPKGFDFFEFPVRGYYAYTYNINPQVSLLVITLRDMAAIKLLAANFLRTALQKDVDNTITTFKLLANNYPPTAVAPAIAAAKLKLDNDSAKVPSQENVTIKDFLDLLNHVSEFTSKYIGAKLTINCWQLTRPDFEGLENFHINGTEITFSGEITEDISCLQRYWIKEWVLAFIRQGCKIIKNLPILIDEKCLNEREKLLLNSSNIESTGKIH